MCSFQDYAIKHGGNFYKEKAFKFINWFVFENSEGHFICNAIEFATSALLLLVGKIFFEVLFLYANIKLQNSLFFELLELKLVLNTIITVGELLQSKEISEYHFQNLFNRFENGIETSQPTI